MPRTAELDPLDTIPRPQVLRPQYERAARRAERLRILLDVAERIHATEQAPIAAIEAAVPPTNPPANG